MKKYLALLLGAALATGIAFGQGRPPIPEFAGQRIYVQGVPNNFDALGKEIKRLEKSSQQTYYVVVIPSTGKESGEYLNALYTTWQGQAQRKELNLDPDRSVIIVLAMTDRELFVRPGEHLKAIGLTPEVLKTQLIPSTAVPHLKAGNYLAGLKALLTGIDAWIARKDPPAPKTTLVEHPSSAKSARSFPTLLVAGIMLALAGLLFLFFWWRHTSTRKRVIGRFEEFKDRVMEMRQRVERVRERHKLLPQSDKDYTQQMTGATLAVYTQVDEEVKQLWEGWMQRMDAWEKVQVLIASQGFLRVGQLKEAETLIDQLSFDEVDRACQGCVESLDRLEQGHEKARALLAEQRQRPESLRQQVATVRALQLNVAPYEDELAKCEALIEEASGLITADPLGGVATLEGARDRLTALGEWMEEVVRLYHRAGKAAEELDEAARRVDVRRSRGLLLIEPEGNPDPLLQQGTEEQSKALVCLQRADAKAAARHLDEAFKLVEKIGSVIEQQEKAREECARELPARRAVADRLRQEMARAQSRQSELQRNFAPESWQKVADNLHRARQLQMTTDTQLEEAASASDDSVQHYFHAVSLLLSVRQQQDEAHELLQAIDTTLRELTSLRQECFQQRQEVSDLARLVQAYLADHGSVLRSATLAQFDSAQQRWLRLYEQFEVSRPNWPAVQEQLAEARKGYEMARKEAEEDVQAHQRLIARLDEVIRVAERIAYVLRQPETRSAASTCFQTAMENLERVQRETTRGQADWVHLLKQLDETAGALLKAEKSAQEDFRLADKARAEIAEAEQAVVRARGHLTLGDPAELSQAESLLSQASDHLTVQEYEQTIEKARSSCKRATQAYNQAVRQAELERQRAEQERQRLQAQAAPVTASHLAASAGSSSPPSAPPMEEEKAEPSSPPGAPEWSQTKW